VIAISTFIDFVISVMYVDSRQREKNTIVNKANYDDDLNILPRTPVISQ